MAKSQPTSKSGTSWTSIPSPKSPNMWNPSPQPPIPKSRAAPIMIPKTLPPRPPPLKATLSEPPLPPPATAAASSIQRRLVPPTGLASAILRDYSDDEVDAELRHLGISFTRTTTKHDKNKLILYHYDMVRRINAEQQQLFDKVQAKSRGISDELI